jgi:hypothetical protein
VVLEVRAAQTVHFCENFNEQKLLIAPNLWVVVRSSWVSGLPRCSAAGLASQQGLLTWSHGNLWQNSPSRELQSKNVISISCFCFNAIGLLGSPSVSQQQNSVFGKI